MCEAWIYGFSQKIWVGTNWEHEIVKGIKECDFFFLFISFSSVESDFVRREVSLAFKYNKNIIPIKVDDTEIPPEWDYQTIDIQWADMRDEDWIPRLLVGIGNFQSYSRKEYSSELLIEEEISEPDEQFQASASETQYQQELEDSEYFNEIIDIFERDFIYPNECDEVVFALQEILDNLSFGQKQLHLQFAFQERISELLVHISEFRKICQDGTFQSDRTRKRILKAIKRLFQDLDAA